MITVETATVYRGGGRRWLTKRAAERAEAKRVINARCECCDGDHVTPSYTCDLHRDPVKLQRMIHLLTVMYVRRASRSPTPTGE